jgi:hypothetical protein
MWYGNPSATHDNTLGGNQTFLFFDDFSGSSVNGGKWGTVVGTPTVANGYINFNTASQGINTSLVYNQPLVLEHKMRVNNYAAVGVVGLDNGINDQNTANDFLWFVNTPGQRIVVWSNAASYDYGDLGTGWRKYKAIWNNNQVITSYDDGNSQTLADTPATNRALHIYANGGNPNFDVDYIFVRSYASPELNITVSSSEFSINASYVEVPYWIESWNASANSSVWVKAPFLQNGTNTTLYMYYGNPEATAASSGANTFDFFDDFSGGLSKWTLTQSTEGYVQILNGEVRKIGRAHV